SLLLLLISLRRRRIRRARWWRARRQSGVEFSAVGRARPPRPEDAIGPDRIDDERCALPAQRKRALLRQPPAIDRRGCAILWRLPIAHRERCAGAVIRRRVRTP